MAEELADLSNWWGELLQKGSLKIVFKYSYSTVKSALLPLDTESLLEVMDLGL